MNTPENPPEGDTKAVIASLKESAKPQPKNDLRLEALNKYAKDNYQEEIDRLTINNVAYCTRLYALVRYFESYFDVYIQNRKEIENLTAKILLESTDVPAIHAEARRVKSNKLNKIKNLDERMQNFVKVFNKEFGNGFKNKELEEELLDLMDEFWNTVIKVEDDKLYIKTK